MIIVCDNNRQVDTARLSPEDRHIIQKLMAWETLVPSMAVFREKTAAALETGWNGSGPVSPTSDLTLVISALTKKVRDRLKSADPGN